VVARTQFVLAATLAISPTARAGNLQGHCTDSKPLQQCIDDMVAELKNSGFIGVEVEDETPDGLQIVTKIIPGSPAEQVGIHVGDQLVAINGIRYTKDNRSLLAKVKLPGKQVICTIRRNGTDQEIKLTLMPMSADLLAKSMGEEFFKLSAHNAPTAPPKK
jgi:C-terminal processing protease CtpA/Prc